MSPRSFDRRTASSACTEAPDTLVPDSLWAAQRLWTKQLWAAACAAFKGVRAGGARVSDKWCCQAARLQRGQQRERVQAAAEAHVAAARQHHLGQGAARAAAAAGRLRRARAARRAPLAAPRALALLGAT